MMITNCDLIIKNGKVFEKNKFKKSHIVIKNGKIFKLTKNIKLFSLKLKETDSSFAEWYSSDNEL